MAEQGKRLREEARDENVELQMTPMIDIVFQLLIFFMLACRFRTEEGEIQQFLPKDRGDGIAPIIGTSINDLRIKLFWVEPNSFRETANPDNGRVLLKVGNRNLPYVTNSFGEVAPDYQKLYEIICHSRDTYRPTTLFSTRPIIIDARPAVPFKHLISALNECVRANMKDITFAQPEIPY